jgi:hypothetical protein
VQLAGGFAQPRNHQGRRDARRRDAQLPEAQCLALTTRTASQKPHHYANQTHVHGGTALAEMEPQRVRVAANVEGVQFAQALVYYYGWCFDDGLDEYCYWLSLLKNLFGFGIRLPVKVASDSGIEDWSRLQWTMQGR